MSLQFSDESVATKFFEMADNVASIKAKLELHTDDFKEVKKKVEKHERVYNVGKYAAVPALGLIHLSLKHLFSKLGF